MQFAVGSYTGNGTDDRQITGVGFQPHLVIIRRETATEQPAIHRTSEMDAGESFFLSQSAAQTNGIKSLDSDGFTVGLSSAVNSNGATYHWMAFRDNGGEDFTVGSYDGNGNSSRDITGLGFQPDIVMVKSDYSETGWWRIASMSNDYSTQFSVGGDGTGRIKSFLSDGFQVGLSQNQSGRSYFWVAWKAKSGWIAEGDFTGDGTDDRNITGVGFQPNLVIQKKAGVDYSALRPSTIVGDKTMYFTANTAEADRIQALQSDGFQVGTKANANGVTQRWAAWKTGNSGGATPKSGSDSGAGTDASTKTVVTEKAGTDAGAGDEASSLQLPAAESGAGQDAASLEVDHELTDSGAGTDVSALQASHDVTETAAGADTAIVTEITQMQGADSGTGADAAALESSLPVSDSGLGAETGASILVQVSPDESAAGGEAARLLRLSEINILSAEIDSRLEMLADEAVFELLEEDPSGSLAPYSLLWRTLDKGDLLRARFGLKNIGYDEYGIFRVDYCFLKEEGNEQITVIPCRDKAAMLADEHSLETFEYGVWPEADATQKTLPKMRTIAKRFAEIVGLKLIWDAPNPYVSNFSIDPCQSLSAHLGRLLEPLRQSRRYYTDAWVANDTLVIRRRGSGPIAGTIDCSIGRVLELRRSPQPQLGDITVRGATYTAATEYENSTRTGQTEGSNFRTLEESPTHRVTETGKVVAGEFVATQRETQDLVFQDVVSAEGRWIGRVLACSITQTEKNLDKSNPTTERKEIHYGFDSEWRCVLTDEKKGDYKSGEFRWTTHTHTRREQLTPTSVQTVVTELRVAADGTETVKADFPKYDVQPGTLHSEIRAAPDPAGNWEENPDGSAPSSQKKTEHTQQYQGTADGFGIMPQLYENEALIGDSICQQIADDLAAESGTYLYQIKLFWPRPFPYRKGQRVTLTNLPGNCPDLVGAVITAIHTRFNETEAVWSHDIELQHWADS